MSVVEQYIHVVNWDRFQHYKVRGAPWIKSYTALLNDRRYLRLTLRQRGLLHSVHLAYAATGRDLGTSTADLRRVLGEDTVRPRDIERLVEAGFLVISASKVLAQREREREIENKPIAPPKPKPAPPKQNGARKARAPDVLWDALVEIIGASPAGLERGKWNKALKSLRDSGATPESLHRAANAYRTLPTFAECAITPLAIANNWTTLVTAPGNGQHKPAGETTEAFRARIAALDAQWRNPA